MSEAAIRAAAPADAELLAALAARLFRETYAAGSDPGDVDRYLAAHFRPEIQAAELADPAMRSFLALAGAVPVGYAQLRSGSTPGAEHALGPAPERTAELARLYVDRRWHGAGVAAALLAACADAARRSGAEILWLSVWQENGRAVRFYEKAGFERRGELRFHLGAELQRDHLMARPLSPVDRPRPPG